MSFGLPDRKLSPPQSIDSYLCFVQIHVLLENMGIGREVHPVSVFCECAPVALPC